LRSDLRSSGCGLYPDAGHEHAWLQVNIYSPQVSQPRQNAFLEHLSTRIILFAVSNSV
jgi:hypothetical protein